MTCTPASLAAGGECYNCALGTKQLWAAAVYLLCSGQASTGYPGAQIVGYTNSPSLDGVTPLDLNSPAIAVKAGGTTYTWDPVGHYWDDGSLLLNLAGYYSFDVDGSDAIGGHDTVIGADSTIAAGGLINDCLSCAGANAGAKIAVVPAAYQPVVGQSFSYSFWIKPSSSSGSIQIIFGVYDNTNANSSHYVRTVSGQLSVQARLSGNHVASTPLVFYTVGAWNHVAYGYDAGANAMWIQVNGGTRKLSGALTGTINAGNAPWWIGNSNLGGSDFPGLIDEVAVWMNRKLFDRDVIGLYNGGAGVGLGSYATTP